MNSRNPFEEFERFVRDLQVRIQDTYDATLVQDHVSYPLFGKACNIVGEKGFRLARVEVHGLVCEDPNHLAIRTDNQRILCAARGLFREGKGYSSGKAYIYFENDQEKFRERLK